MARVALTVMETLKALLVKECGPALPISESEEALQQFSRDESGLPGQPPQLVVYAQSTAQVQAVVRACRQLKVPLTPVGARSGKSGGSIPTCGGVALSLEKMNQIIGIQVDDLTATVQPGVVTAELHRAADAVGLMYAPDPNSSDWCTIGGNVAENAGGPRALKYGVTRDAVLELLWVFPDGSVERLGRKTMKGVAGFDLVSLCVGSEGTLGIATEITVKLLPKPRAVLTALASFESVEKAAQAVTQILKSGSLPRALELLDEVALEAVKGRALPVSDEAQSVVLIELDGFSAEALMLEMEELEKTIGPFSRQPLLVAQSEAQRTQIWQVRQSVSPALRELKKFKLSEDIVVPRSKLVEAIRQFKAAGAEHGLTVATYGHAGDGNLHTNVLFEGPHQQKQVDAVMAQVMKITIDLGGTITGEHGVGLAKRAFLAAEQSASLISFQKKLKQLVDPENLFNPGKIFPD